MKAKYLQGTFVAVFVAEVLLCVIPFIHVYVHREYYVTYSLIISQEDTGYAIQYSHYEGLSDRLTRHEPPKEVFSPDSLQSISELRKHGLISIESIGYPNGPLTHLGYLTATALEKDPTALLFIIQDISNYQDENKDYLISVRMDNRILSMIARVKYGGETHDVVFDSPSHLPGDPNCIVSDVALHRDARVEPDWLVTLKVISWILYPAMLVPSAVLAWVALGGRRRELSIVLIMTLFALSFAYAYGVVTGNPKGLMDYLTHNPHALRVANKMSITVLGIRKVIEVNASEGEETINLSRLMTPYEIKALRIVRDYLNTHKIIITTISPNPSIEVSVAGAKKIGSNVYALNLPYRPVSPEELGDVEIMIKHVTRGNAGAEAYVYVYVGFPIEVRACLEG